MTLIKMVLAIAASATVHALFLRFAVKIMVEVTVRYGHAFAIVLAQYATAALVAGALILGGIDNPLWTTTISGLGSVFVGAVLIGRTLRFSDSEPVGTGNGVLIQFMQIPLVVPFVILASFLVDPGT